MSRIGKQPILIPANTRIEFMEGGRVTVTGPRGSLSREFRQDIVMTEKESMVTLSPVNDSVSTRALWGTYAAHIRNMVQGVHDLFEKRLIIEGVGFRVEFAGNALKFSIGFSHPVLVPVPEGIEAAVEKNTITIRGISKEEVGEFAARVRAIKKPEPYKGKGIRYSNEVVRRKQGKKSS